MNTNDAVSTYQLVACLAVKLCLLGWMSGAEQSLLEGRNEGGHVSSQGVQVDDLMGCKVVPVLVGFLAEPAYKPTSATKGNRLAFGALVAHRLVAGAHLLEGVLDVEEIVDVEGSLEL